MTSELRAFIVVPGALALLCGLAYPLIVTVAAQQVYPGRAHGSLLVEGGQRVGSQLIGQAFTAPGHFWGRPSTCLPRPYDPAAARDVTALLRTEASHDALRARVVALRSADPAQRTAIPRDLVTPSASGLDPHVTLAAALYQVHRVALERNLVESSLRNFVLDHVEGRQWGLWGERRVNILELNLDLDHQPITLEAQGVGH